MIKFIRTLCTIKTTQVDHLLAVYNTVFFN